jgi:hypothetical protein
MPKRSRCTSTSRTIGQCRRADGAIIRLFLCRSAPALGRYAYVAGLAGRCLKVKSSRKVGEILHSELVFVLLDAAPRKKRWIFSMFCTGLWHLNCCG